MQYMTNLLAGKNLLTKINEKDRENGGQSDDRSRRSPVLNEATGAQTLRGEGLFPVLDQPVHTI